jgi:hypothetical protein
MRKNHDLQKHTLNLRRGDVDRLREVFPNVEVSTVIRKVVSKFVDDCRTETPIPKVEVKLD